MNLISDISDPFLRAYLTSAFFTNDDDAPSGDYESSDRPDVMIARLSAEALELAKLDCAKFEEENAELLKLAGDYSQNGHDFWLTRNRHGCGFWDRGYDDDVSKGLSEACHKFGETDLYEGDDGKLYFSR